MPITITHGISGDTGADAFFKGLVSGAQLAQRRREAEVRERQYQERLAVAQEQVKLEQDQRLAGEQMWQMYAGELEQQGLRGAAAQQGGMEDMREVVSANYLATKPGGVELLARMEGKDRNDFLDYVTEQAALEAEQYQNEAFLNKLGRAVEGGYYSEDEVRIIMDGLASGGTTRVEEERNLTRVIRKNVQTQQKGEQAGQALAVLEQEAMNAPENAEGALSEIRAAQAEAELDPDGFDLGAAVRRIKRLLVPPEVEEEIRQEAQEEVAAQLLAEQMKRKFGSDEQLMQQEAALGRGAVVAKKHAESQPPAAKLKAAEIAFKKAQGDDVMEFEDFVKWARKQNLSDADVEALWARIQEGAQAEGEVQQPENSDLWRTGTGGRKIPLR